MKVAVNTKRPVHGTVLVKKGHIDRPFFLTTLALVVIGFFIFSSASLGLLAREGVKYSDVAVSQLVLGVGGGMLALTLLARVPYGVWKRAAPYLFGCAVLLTALVFVPFLGYEANGARRWLNIFGLSVQPAEFLKLASVLALAWYYSVFYKRIDDIRFALTGLLIVLFCAGAPLILQPDTGTFVIISFAGVAIAFAAGVRWLHFSLLLAVLAVGVGALAYTHPYLLERITTFMDPASDPQGAGYQIKQSLIAIGSGGLVGRGFGQSVQKFNYLPEPIGDSIFSVAGEEFGFLGSVVILGLFAFFALRGLVLASRAPDRFGGLIIVGVVILLVSQSFINIASMVGLMPLTGEPLAFMSHGGTSLFMALASVGIVLNVSRHIGEQKRMV